MVEYRVLTARPDAEAHVVLGALLSEGLRARLERDGLGVVYGLTTGRFATKILVADDDFSQASQLLADIEHRGDMR